MRSQAVTNTAAEISIGVIQAPAYPHGSAFVYELPAIRTALWLRAGYTADCAASNMLSRCSAHALSGTASPAPVKASSGAVGMYAHPGGRAVVQRSVHDMASLQYQRMSAHA